MNCYDCATAGTTSPAVAICHDCGAGVCLAHAAAVEHHLTRTVAVNRLVDVEPPARLIRCLVCNAAHEAAVHEADSPHRTHHHHLHQHRTAP